MIETPRPRVLVVDDEPMNVKVLVDLLRPSYNVVVARDGFQALERLRTSPLPDLALIDVMMPGMTGYELSRRMQQDAALAEVPVIFVSALSQASDETEGFESGAVDYISKPISPTIVLARVKTHIALRNATRAMSERNQALEEIVEMRTRELAMTQDMTIRAFASIVEARDNETGAHLLRSQRYVRLLGEEMRRDPRFETRLTPRAVELMGKAAPLHDIGKVGIADSILQKPGKLTAEEYEIMKTHTDIGRRALMIVSGENSRTSDFMRIAIEITGSHHEKWDGTGYPEGLADEAIPISARMMALADVYDALTRERVYKPAMSHREAKAIIVAGRGSHFDPGVVDAFLRREREFEEIATTFRELDAEPGLGTELLELPTFAAP
jgi:putative two-component system response regulator